MGSRRMDFAKKFNAITAAGSPVSVFGNAAGGNVNASKYPRMPHDKIIPFPEDLRPEKMKDIFDDYSDQDMNELTASIQEHGVLQPIILRKSERVSGKYEVLAGHHRLEGNKRAGNSDIPYLEHDCDDPEAIVIFSHTNRNQRKQLKPSALAFSYKMEVEAVESRQGQRNAAGGKSEAVEQIAKLENKNSRTIYRYLQLTALIRPFLEMLDSDRLTMKAALPLSALPQSEQETLSDILSMYDITAISPAQSEKLAELSQSGTLTREAMETMFSPSRPAKVKQTAKPVKIQLMPEVYQAYFPDKKPKEIEQIILMLLQERFAK